MSWKAEFKMKDLLTEHYFRQLDQQFERREGWRGPVPIVAKEMAEHTPGPWHVSEGRAGAWMVIARHNPIAELYNEHPEGNARLMAEAPTLKQQNEELLEALERIAAETQGEIVPNRVLNAEVHSIAHTAIDKAGGSNAS